jgi:hypothetical protein
MSEISDVDRRLMIIDRWVSTAGDMLDYHENWTEQHWDDFGSLSAWAMNEVIRSRPDLDTEPLAEFFNKGARLQSQTWLINTVMRAMGVLRVTAETIRKSSGSNPQADDVTKPAESNGVPPLQLSPFRSVVLKILAKSKSRLTNPALRVAMLKDEPIVSKDTLRIELARMSKAGWIDNDQTTRPKGYAITDLGREVMKEQP